MNKVCCCFKKNNNRFVVHQYDLNDEENEVDAATIYPTTVMTSTDSCNMSSYNEKCNVFYFNQPDPYESDFKERGLTLKFKTEAAQYKANQKAAEKKINNGLLQAQEVLNQQQEYAKKLDQARNTYLDADEQVEARIREHEEGSADDLGATPESGRHSTVDLKKRRRDAEDQYQQVMHQSFSISGQWEEAAQSLNDSIRQREDAASELETLKKKKKEYDMQKERKEDQEIAKMIQLSIEENAYYGKEIIQAENNEMNTRSCIDMDDQHV
jgi:hypothetical protein